MALTMADLLAQNQALLDTIKGGAITTFEQDAAAALAKHNADITAALLGVDTATLATERGYVALNYNNDFKDTVVVGGNEWPIGMTWNSSYDFNVLFVAEMITVKNEADPVTRPQVVKDLLECMGLGQVSALYDGGFKVLKMTLQSLPGGSESLQYMHLLGDYRLSMAGGLTNMYYLRSPETGNVWVRKFQYREGVTTGYHHFDAHPFRDAVPGDEIYIALPTSVPGVWPESVNHTLLNNPRNQQVRDDNYIIKQIPSS